MASVSSKEEFTMQWTKLNTDWLDIVTSIRSEWSNLMARDDAEEEYHKFIADHSAMCWGNDTYFSISKLELAGRLTPDFILVSEKGSLGLHYTLVEIEKPSTLTITQQGNPAAGLTHAIKQVRDWKTWIERNSQEAATLFPSKFSHDSFAHISYMIVAGKRAGTTLAQEIERAKQAKEVGYAIRSFDFITDNLNNFRASEHIFPNSDTSQEHWNNGYYHKFANPFYKSVTNKDWKKFVVSPSLIRSHMIGQNIVALDEMMSTNEKYQEFIKRTTS